MYGELEMSIDLSQNEVPGYYINRIIGMSFGVRFKVRTFGNKHPDGSNVRISFCRETDHSTCITYTFTCMLIECSLERTFMTKSC